MTHEKIDLVDVFRKWEASHNRENYGRYDAFKAGCIYGAGGVGMDLWIRKYPKEKLVGFTDSGYVVESVVTNQKPLDPENWIHTREVKE